MQGQEHTVRRRRLLDEVEQMFIPLEGTGSVKAIERRLNDCRSLVKQTIDRVYLDFQSYNFLMHKIDTLTSKLQSSSTEPAPEKIKSSHTSSLNQVSDATGSNQSD